MSSFHVPDVKDLLCGKVDMLDAYKVKFAQQQLSGGQKAANRGSKSTAFTPAPTYGSAIHCSLPASTERFEE